MSDLSFSYIKKRGEFGKQAQFCEQGPEFCDSILPNVKEHKLFILRNPIHEMIQVGKPWSTHDANTRRVKRSTSGANHAEGGWPLEVNCNDPESTQRYRRRMEKEDHYIGCVNNCAGEIEHYVLQNNAVDLFNTYFSEIPPLPVTEKSFIRSLNAYRETAAVPRVVTNIDWKPDGGPKFAVSYAKADFGKNSLASMSANIWDLSNNVSPETVLESSSCVIDIKYSFRDPSILAGGLMNGRIAIWDVRTPTVVRMSAPHNAHRDLVRKVQFIHSKSGMECLSVGADGACKWWDVRQMEEPTDEMIVDIVRAQNQIPTVTSAWGISSLNFEPTMPTRFLVGTENGYVVYGNRKGKTQMEKFSILYDAHYGPVKTVQRNPAFLKVFLTVGDWCIRIWNEDNRESSILMIPPQLYYCTCAQWSPVKYPLILMTQTNGYLSCYDLLKSQHQSVASAKICQEALVTVSWHENGQTVACGSETGNIYTQELSPNFVTNDKQDKILLQAIFERESAREKILEAKNREIKLKMRAIEEGGGSIHSLAQPSLTQLDIDNITKEYFAMVHKEMSNMV